MADILTDTLTIKVNNDEFVFKIPSPREQNKVKLRAAALRRQDDPTSYGFEEGLDWISINSYRGMALMEMLLQKSSATWAFTPGDNGVMVCDSAKFPNTIGYETFAEVWATFSKSLDDFRGVGDKPGQPAGGEAVAG